MNTVVIMYSIGGDDVSDVRPQGISRTPALHPAPARLGIGLALRAPAQSRAATKDLWDERVLGPRSLGAARETDGFGFRQAREGQVDYHLAQTRKSKDKPAETSAERLLGTGMIRIRIRIFSG